MYILDWLQRVYIVIIIDVEVSIDFINDHIRLITAPVAAPDAATPAAKTRPSSKVWEERLGISLLVLIVIVFVGIISFACVIEKER